MVAILLLIAAAVAVFLFLNHPWKGSLNEAKQVLRDRENEFQKSEAGKALQRYMHEEIEVTSIWDKREKKRIYSVDPHAFDSWDPDQYERPVKDRAKRSWVAEAYRLEQEKRAELGAPRV